MRDYPRAISWQIVRAELRHGEATVPATMDDVQTQLDQLARTITALTDVVASLDNKRGNTEQPATIYDWVGSWVRFVVPGFG